MEKGIKGSFRVYMDISGYQIPNNNAITRKSSGQNYISHRAFHAVGKHLIEKCAHKITNFLTLQHSLILKDAHN